MVAWQIFDANPEKLEGPLAPSQEFSVVSPVKCVTDQMTPDLSESCVVRLVLCQLDLGGARRHIFYKTNRDLMKSKTSWY